MKTLIVRRNHRFHIDRSQLSQAANKEDVCNALYAAVYDEFRGADKNRKYMNMTYVQRIEEVNKFANDWLKQRGLD